MVTWGRGKEEGAAARDGDERVGRPSSRDEGGDVCYSQSGRRRKTPIRMTMTPRGSRPTCTGLQSDLMTKVAVHLHAMWFDTGAEPSEEAASDAEPAVKRAFPALAGEVLSPEHHKYASECAAEWVRADRGSEHASTPASPASPVARRLHGPR